MKFHSYAEIFPLLEGAAFDELVEDIKAQGLREKIWLYEGKILDGRNRFLACQKARIKPAYRQYIGKDALAFVVSVNVHRRHLTVEQRAFAAARIATLRLGANQHEGASREAPSQTETAENLDVSRSSVQRAKKVLEKGSKALQKAAESGEIPLKKAAAVVDLPKSEQLAAATAKPTKSEDSDEPDRPDISDDEEDAALALAERELAESTDKWLRADDKLAAAQAEIKRQAAEIAVLKLSRDGYMNGKQAVTKMLQAEQRKVAALEKKLKAAESDNETLRERIAVMEAA